LDNRDTRDWREIAYAEGMEVEPEIVSEEIPLDPPDESPETDGVVEVIIGEIVEVEPVEEDDDNFSRNLAEEMDPDVLATLASSLVDDFKAHEADRADWQEQITRGLDLLGFNTEERDEPFEGASGATHPLLAEAAYQFQSQAFNEMLPAKGPARTVVLGKQTPDKMARANRVRNYLNYYITDVMEEYETEADQLFLHLALSGSAFKKHWYDETLGRIASRFVSADNVVVPGVATDLETCEFVAHRMPNYSSNDVRKLQVQGLYRDVDFMSSYSTDLSEIEDKVNEIVGTSGAPPQALFASESCTLIEFHVSLDLPGFEDTDAAGEETGVALPYIVTVLEDNLQVLSITRNYRPDDPKRRKLNYFTHYRFLPGLGFYGTGLIQAIGGLSKAATAALRQLMDAGTLANLPAGFKLKNLRVSDNNEPLQPGEWRDVDSVGDSIRDSLFPLPYKEPSQTLFALLGFVVEAGQRFVGVTNLKVGDGPENVAMGTVMALIEQGSRVMSAIHKRMHRALRAELKILTRLVSEHVAEDGYPYTVANADQSVQQADFDPSIVEVLPVSDPNVFSRTQRIVMAQTLLEAATAAPQMYDMHAVHRQFLDAMGFENIDALMLSTVQNTDTPIDPAQENINALDQVKLKAFPGQDHSSHIMAHIVFGSTPMVGAQPLVGMALQKHIMEHAKLQAEEEAAQVAQPGSRQFDATVAKLIAQNMLRVKELSQQVSQQGQPQQDPVVMLKEMELQQRQQSDQAKQQLDQMKAQLNAQTDQQRLQAAEQQRQSNERMAQARIDAAREADQRKIAAQDQRMQEQLLQQAQAERQRQQLERERLALAREKAEQDAMFRRQELQRRD